MIDETNIRTGTEAENFVAQFFAKQGWLVLNLNKSRTGSQPYDQIAIGRVFTFNYDVKHCKDNYFPFDRIEQNQINALGYLQNEVMNPRARQGFVLVYKNELYWFSYIRYELEKGKKKSINPKQLPKLETVLKETHGGKEWKI